jgi:hypothetical protein
MSKIIKIIVLIFVLGLMICFLFLPFEISRKMPEKYTPVRIY